MPPHPDLDPHLEALVARTGCTEHRWMIPRTQVVVAHWVRMKCEYGCPGYGKNACCPPNVPAVDECRRFFDEYVRGVVLHFRKVVARPEDRHAWSRGVNRGLVDLERDAFLAGHERAFVLFMDSCGLCDECASRRVDCQNPRLGRPSPEALAVDVFSTVRSLGFPIRVLTAGGDEMNRYAFLLLD